MAIARQISVFVENRPGGLMEMCGVLGEAAINIQAIMVPGGTDYGIVHIIVDEHEAALQSLEERGYRTYTAQVLDMRIDDHPGALAGLADRLREAEVDIKYAYSAVAGTHGRLILSVSDVQRAHALLEA